MNHSQVEQILEDTKRRFLAADEYLLAADVNERSLTHKFAEHLQSLVGKEWSVDCEYNRYGDDAKKIDEIKGIVGLQVSTDETKSRTVYPDIIVHKRGPQGPNLLVIEAKKDASDYDREADWRKLERLRGKYQYSF